MLSGISNPHSKAGVNTYRLSLSELLSGDEQSSIGSKDKKIIIKDYNF
jgi:hypothetical protein